MGMLVEGRWHKDDTEIQSRRTGGRFVRPESAFRSRITSDGSTPHAPEKGRYRLYVSYACPWAHRTLVYRALFGLEDAIRVTVVDPFMGRDGWAFGDDPEPLFAAQHLHEIYTRARSDYTGRVTVPVLWDDREATIVSNESADILRMLNEERKALGGSGADLYPAELRSEIDATNDLVYPNVNNGVYRCGFASTQEAYEEAFHQLFATLDQLDERLGRQRYLVGHRITEADWRLFTTLVRFDAVYVGHFKCNLRRIADYPNLSGYLRELTQWPGVGSTVHFDHIKRHYYESHRMINPTGVVPAGPVLDLDAPHGRGDA